MKKITIALLISLIISLNASAFYSDVTSDNQYYDSIKNLYELGKLPEEANNQFLPDELLSKADLYKLILSYSQSEIEPTAKLTYSDTDNNAEYARYLQTAINLHLITPEENKPFGVTSKTSKYIALSTMFQILGIGTPAIFNKDDFPFKDIGASSNIAAIAKKASDLDIFEKDKPERFNMSKKITKGEAANYLYKIYQNNGTSNITLTVQSGNSGNSSKYSKTEQELLDNKEFSVLLDVWSRLQDHYYYQDELDDTSLIQGAIKGMVEKLSDKYTVYQEPSPSGNLLNTLTGEYEGIGVVIEMIEKQITIVTPFKDSPAEKAGLKANDIIVEVDGENIIGQSLDYAASKIKGAADSEVKIKVLRDKKEINFTVKRSSIVNKSVKDELIQENGKKIGYINVINFGEDTYQEFKDAATSLIAKKANGFIIDLRNNPGGYLDVSVDIIGLFTKEKKTAVTLENADGSTKTYKTDGNGLLEGYKVVILINAGSASASEIMAGALQDYGIAKLIGVTSFGKGSAQEVRQYYDGSLFKYTISKWITPEGQVINKKGLTPDKVVEDNNDAQLKAAKAEF